MYKWLLFFHFYPIQSSVCLLFLNLCKLGCPGTEFESDGHSLFNNDGICVNKRQVERRLKAKNALYQFDENFSQDNKKIKHCDTESQEQDKCQCAQVVGKEPQLGNLWF